MHPDWKILNTLPEHSSITLTGFLIHSPEGPWILSPDPHLKTCCIGKTPHQIALEGDFSHLRSPITLQGTLQHLPEATLSQITVLEAKHSSFPLYTLLGGLLLLLLWRFFKKLRK